MTEDNTKHPLRRPAVVGSILVGSVGLSALLTATQLGKVSTRNAEEDLDNLKTTPPETQRLVEKIQAEAAQIAATANQLETNISTLDSGQQAAVRRILNLDTAERIQSELDSTGLLLKQVNTNSPDVTAYTTNPIAGDQVVGDHTARVVGATNAPGGNITK